MKWLPFMVVLLIFFTAASLSAQEEPAVEPTPEGVTEEESAEPTEEETPNPDEETSRTPDKAVALVENWKGEITLREAGGADFALLAPVEEEIALLFIGDTIKTSEGASITIKLNDGTVIEIGPDSELVLDQDEQGMFIARLNYGYADVTIGSDNFEFHSARHKVTGKDSRVIAKSSDGSNLELFGVEDGALVENEFGLLVYLGQGQKIESTYLSDEKKFLVSVHEYNEMGLKLEVFGEGRMFDPGTRFKVDQNLNIEILGAEDIPTQEEKIPPPPRVPIEVKEAHDEPFEDAGDIQEINKITPTKP